MSAHAPAFAVSTGALAALLVAAHAPCVRADDEPGVAQRCIYVNRIDQTRIVDERSILFFMRDRTVLQNVLRKSCAGLRKSDRIEYDVVHGKLCADELVRQLIEVGGYTPGGLCKIGMFVPISKDEAQALLPSKKSKRDRATGRHAIESKPVELPPPASSEPVATAPAPPAGGQEPGDDPEPEAR